ncbi:pilus assembly protein N-terminal domain-containing protein [Sphingomonas sp. MMS24-JH45]
MRLIPLHRGIAAAAIAGVTLAPVATAAAPLKRAAIAGRPAKRGAPPVGVTKPTTEKWLSVGEGELITLPSNIVDVWTSNAAVADVYVSNPRQIHLFGKDFGKPTVFATDASGAVIYAATIHVAQDFTSLDKMLRAAMPEADIKVTQVGQIAVLNGTVASPDDSAQAMRLVSTLLKSRRRRRRGGCQAQDRGRQPAAHRDPPAGQSAGEVRRR